MLSVIVRNSIFFLKSPSTMTVTLTVWSLLFLFAVLQGFFLCFLLLSTPVKRYYSPNYWIATVVLTFTGILLINVVYWNKLNFTKAFIHIHESYWPLVFLLGPLLFMYIRSQVKVEGKRAWQHFLLPVLVMLALLPFYLQSGEEKIRFFMNGQHLQAPFRWLRYGLVVGSILQVCLYVWLNFRLIRQFDGPPEFVNDDCDVRQWLSYLAAAFAIFAALYVVYYILVDWLQFPVEWDYIISLSMAGLIYYLGVKAYRQPELFKERERLEFQQRKGAGRLQTAAEISACKSLIRKVMEEQRPYLSAQLKLHDLAEMVGLTPHQLSYFLNRHMNTTFAEFVNAYRVLAAQKMLLDKTKSHLKITSIGYEAGFNSKTAFYTIFKKHAGLPPAAYQKKGMADPPDSMP